MYIGGHVSSKGSICGHIISSKGSICGHIMSSKGQKEVIRRSKRG